MAYTESLRNEAADTNLDVARKRARLSNSPACDDEPEIEALAPEDIGGDPVRAIQVEDEYTAMAHYSDSFQVWSDLDAVKQIRFARRNLTGQNYLGMSAFLRIENWITEHLDDTLDHSSEKLREKYQEDDVFFAELGCFAVDLLLNPDFCPREELIGWDDSGDDIQRFFASLVRLSVRHVLLLPDKTKETLARRDSAQHTPMSNSGQQTIPALAFVHFLGHLLGTSGKTAGFFREMFGVDWKRLKDNCRFIVQEEHDLCGSLVVVLSDLVVNANQITDGWYAIKSILSVVRFDNAHAGDSAEDIVNLINTGVMPLICEKHPRALPEGFHAHVVSVCAEAIHVRATSSANRPEDCYRLYERVVHSDDAALLGEGFPSESTLERLCDSNGAVRADLLRAAWLLCACKSFIFSSIMDIRSCGIAMLRRELCTWLKTTQCPAEESAVLQYAARFLRQNELTRYIFSPDSHASIIGHSASIVNFLAVTSHYTDQESDVIWQACMTSVEAGFVKASFAVMQDVCRDLDFDRLLYVTQKFTTASVDRITSGTAVDLLGTLLRYAHGAALNTGNDEHMLSLTQTTFKILSRLHAEKPSTALSRLQEACMIEIQTASTEGSSVRSYLYGLCASEVAAQSELASVSVTVVAAILQYNGQVDPKRLLDALPLNDFVSELCAYVRKAKGYNLPTTTKTTGELRERISIVLRLLSFRDPVEAGDMDERICRVLLHEDAIDNSMREVAWIALRAYMTSQNRSVAAVAHRLRDCFFATLLASLDAANATPALIHLALERLKSEANESLLQGQLMQMLDAPAWNKLFQIAIDSSDAAIAQGAANALCVLLFSWPQDTNINESIADCQIRFVGKFTDWLCAEFSQMSEEDAQLRRFTQAINVLGTVLEASRKQPSRHQLRTSMETLTLEGSDVDPQAFTCSLQIYSPQDGRIVRTVQAMATSTVSELSGLLSRVSGTKHNRVVVGGRLVNLEREATQKLSDVGIEASGVIMICPVYTAECELDTVLTKLGPLEREMLAQYDRFEVFLDGPVTIARRTFDLLRSVRPSASTRFRICSSDMDVETLLPSHSPYRTISTAHVLATNLADFARVGVANGVFIARGVRLLTACLMDHTRPFEATILEPIVTCMCSFLQERPPEATSYPYFEDATSLARRLIGLLELTMQMPNNSATGPSPYRTRLASALYSLVLEASRIDGCVWRSFTRDDRFNDLHACVLLDRELLHAGNIVNLVNSFCFEETTPEGALASYWQAIIATIPLAMKSAFGTTAFFNLANDVLSRLDENEKTEQHLRDVIQTMWQHLRTYRHAECVESPFSDETIGGLLRLLEAAVNALKSFKKPLHLHGLAVDLMDSLLFPEPAREPRTPPLLHEHSRSLVYTLLRATSETVSDYNALANKAADSMDALPSAMFPGFVGWMRQPNVCAGLVNLGMTCYMNSLLQQLFANLAFRRFLFDTPVSDPVKQNFLSLVQELFLEMQDSLLPWINPSALATALNVHVDSQEDVHGFYSTFLEVLQTSMPDSEHVKALASFYGGKLISQVKGECGHVSSQTEAFTELAITVKNKASLRESLDEFVQGEPMQGSNKYRCQSCDPTEGGRLVDAMKRTCLDETPDNLTFCLKRFTFEAMMGLEGKVNDRFDFPSEIDMARYQRTHLENPSAEVVPDMFDLVGVIVHQGSLEYGHYWSYVRLAASGEPAIWVQLEDKNVRPCRNVQEVTEQCAGGLLHPNGMPRADSAYVLFYRRRKAHEIQVELTQEPQASPYDVRLTPPRVQAPLEAAQSLLADNYWRWRITHLFGQQFSDFMTWLLSTRPGGVQLESPNIDSPNIDSPMETTMNAVTSGLVHAASRYLLRIVGSEAEPARKTRAFFKTITDVQSCDMPHSVFQKEFVVHAVNDSLAHLAQLWRHEDRTYRAIVSQYVAQCLQELATSQDSRYATVFETVLKLHASYLPELDEINQVWHEYLGFVTSMATLGPRETLRVLMEGYLEAAWLLMYQQRSPGSAKRSNISTEISISTNEFSLTVIFELIVGLLNKHVNHNYVTFKQEDDEPYSFENGKVHLRPRDIRMLTLEQNGEWCLANVALHRCGFAKKESWLDWAPSRLLRVLAECGSQDFRALVERTLLMRCDQEQYYVEPVLRLALSYCTATKHQSANFIKAFSQPLSGWKDHSDLEMVQWWTGVAAIVRRPAIDSAIDWASNGLKIKEPVRKLTIGFLSAHVFADAHPKAVETASRIRVSRVLADQCLPELKQAYNQEHTWPYLADMLQVMMMEAEWLKNVHEKIRLVEEAGQTTVLGREVTTEYAESKRTLVALTQTLEDLKDWEVGAMVTMSAVDRSGSVVIRMAHEGLDDADPESDTSLTGGYDEDDYV
ncbi:hypothetical protein BAUCODRAFT_129382 [Baudoinia panamericana UAMH 10762]|uniref:USP domain-containing protein n=1 Tax=Baudoinia panamericana (strain UAMH 10762) TaxID=717646 RepID=M2NJ52_BAUPA|nr:uncharacterized protein BAUCODRAFT_129382 [Baudoinia panamericana UAMH 10762]EMC99150.1 hypothetical protein BAUCODRAFT_129382 [Baudoinia panamericana UAMH 10762]